MSETTLRPFFGRAYTLTVWPQGQDDPIVISSDGFGPQALRFTFDIRQAIYGAWTAEIVIYNADAPLQSGPSAGGNLQAVVLQEGSRVQVCAGYRYDFPDGAIPTVIFDGPLFYPILDRDDGGVDTRLILHCILGRTITSKNFINEAIPKLSTQYSQARLIAEKSTQKIVVDPSTVSALLPPGQLPRGKSFFGVPSQYLDTMARQNGYASWFTADSWKVSPTQAQAGDVVASYAPISRGEIPRRENGITYTLVAMPQQTQLGVDFTVLLDPSVQVSHPLPKVAVASQYIRGAEIPYPLPQGYALPRPLLGEYVVAGVRFLGDTHANPWYSQITGLTSTGDQISTLGAAFTN